MTEPGGPHTSDIPSSIAPAPVIGTKLVPPHLPSVLVDRPERLARLDDAAQVVAVVAPAGYGKTVLVRHWLDAVRGRRVAWYSLDALDANPLCFWRHVVSALELIDAIGPEPGSILAERGADTAFLHSLVHVVSSGGPVVLVLDDLHFLRERTTLDQLALLAERAGAHLQLVFTARTAPALPLSRWRLDGRLTSVGAAELQFDERHAADLLRGYRCAALADDELRSLVDSTEGWVAGLQLAALARPDDVLRSLRDLPAQGAEVAEYLVTEVLDGLPEVQRSLVLSVSVLDDFDVGLAAGVTGRNDVEAQVRALEYGGVFLTRSGDEHPTYRFHQLFRELLRRQLQTTEPDEWVRLHRIAAHLLAERGQMDAAFNHLMLAGDLEGAVDLVIRPGLSLSDSGWGGAYRRWLEQLPSAFDTADADLMIDLGFANFTAGRLDVADVWLDRAAAIVGSSDRRIVLRRLASAVARGDHEALDGGREQYEGSTPSGTVDRFAPRVHTILARAALLRGDVAEADELLDVAERAADATALAVAVPGVRARARALEGEVTAAAALADQALAVAAAVGVGPNPAVLEAMIGATAAALGAGDAERAAARLDELLEVADTVDYPYSRAHAAAMTVQLRAVQLGWAAIAGDIDDLCEQAGWKLPSPLEHLVQSLRVRAFLAAGRVAEAEAVADTMAVGPARALAEAAILLAQRRYGEVHQALRHRHGWQMRDEVDARILCAMASTGDEADEHIRVALELSAPAGLVQPFLDRGDDLDRLLRRAPEHLRGFVAAAQPPLPERDRVVPPMVEPLTNRELELLHLLPTHLSNAAMGERLYVSVNTVKTNLRAVYRKLGTTSRAETVVRARRLGLLPPEIGAG